MPWNITVVNRRVLDLSRAMTSTVSVLSVWGFRMHARRFMGFLNANYAKISVSKPSALGLRCLKRSHPHFPVAPRRPPRPLVSPRPGVRMLSSRRWRVSRQASPFLHLPLPSTCDEYLYPSPGARDTVSFGLDDILLTAASDSEDFGPALVDALPPSGQEARPSAAYSELSGCAFARH